MNRSPYVSGCYIVKDEEPFIAASLEALRPFVDELVVYDTGSTDRTREIAAAHGARVVEGYWDDDFGAARNRALRHCTGTWVVSIDADEVVVGDAAAWRRDLRATRADMLLVEVVSTSWEGAGEESRTLLSRVMRRSRCRWEGALHEQIVARSGRLDAAPHTPHLVLQHHGYQATLFAARDKGARNLAISETALRRALEGGGVAPQDLATLQVNLGRSACAAGDNRRAVEVFAAVDRGALPPAVGVTGAHAAVDSALRTGAVDLARAWIDAARAWGEGEQVLALFEGRLAIARGELDRAETILRSVRDGRDFRGLPVDATAAQDHLVECLLKQGRPEAALDVLLPHLASGRSSIHSTVAVALAGSLPGGLERLAGALPPALLRPYVGQLAAEPAAASAGFFEALWAAGRERTTVMLAASTQWASLDFESALRWSLRLREAGLARECPLRRVLGSADQDTITRVLSGAVLLEIGEVDVLPELEAQLSEVGDEQVPELLARLRPVAPDLADRLVLA